MRLCVFWLCAGCTAWFGDRQPPRDLAGLDEQSAPPDLLEDLSESSADLSGLPSPDLIGRDLAGAVVWAPLPNLTGAGLRALWGCTNADLYAVGTGGAVLRRAAGNWTLAAAGSADLLAVGGSTCADVYAAGAAGAMFYSPGSGVWTAQNSRTTVALNGIWGSPVNMTVVGEGGVIRGTPSGNANWKVRTSMTTSTLRAAWGVGSTVYAGGDGGALVVSLDNGDTWSPRMSGTTNTIRGGAATDSGTVVLLVGDDGMVRKSTDGGTSFSSLPAPAPGIVLYGVWALGAEIFVVGQAGTIAHSSDGGASWQAETANGSGDLRAVFGFSAADVYAVGDSGLVVHRP